MVFVLMNPVGLLTSFTLLFGGMILGIRHLFVIFHLRNTEADREKKILHIEVMLLGYLLLVLGLVGLWLCIHW